MCRQAYEMLGLALARCPNKLSRAGQSDGSSLPPHQLAHLLPRGLLQTCYNPARNSTLRMTCFYIVAFGL
jgi:hypothetical protein